MIMKSTTLLAAGTLLFMGTACSQRTGWSIDGTVGGVDKDTKLAIEANNAGHWYVLDSVATDNNGKFSYMAPEPAHFPEILRVTLPGKGSVYFPVDSVDAVTLTADAASYGKKQTLGGTALAATIGAIDSLVSASTDVDVLRRQLVDYITSDTTAIVSYYIIGKSVGSEPLYNPNEALGNRVYGAAAQVFANRRPNDPRGAALRQAFFNGRIALGKATPTEQVIELPEAGLIDIVRYDDKGQSHSLADIAKQNNVVLLSFTNYALEVSPAYNAILYDVYQKNLGKGLGIYQLAFDGNEVTWKEAARNLPWTTVWNAPTDGSSVVVQYNVGVLPLTYIIKNGELVERVADPEKLAAAVNKYL